MIDRIAYTVALWVHEQGFALPVILITTLWLLRRRQLKRECFRQSSPQPVQLIGRYTSGIP